MKSYTSLILHAPLGIQLLLMMRTGDNVKEGKQTYKSVRRGGERGDIRELSDPYVLLECIVHVGDVVDEVLSTASVPVKGNKVDLN